MADDIYIDYDNKAHMGPNFEIDTSLCRQYCYVYVQGYGVVHIKAEDEGIVVDVYKDAGDINEPAATLSVTKEEINENSQ